MMSQISAMCLFLITFVGFYGCTGADDTDITPEIVNTNKIKEISLEDIPTGVTPIVVKNNNELKQLINKLENVKIYIGKNDPNNNVRFKTRRTEETQDLIFYSVRVDVVYFSYGSNVTISVYLTGFHPGVELSDITTSYNWHDKHYLDYSVSYTLNCYININGKYVYYSDSYSEDQYNLYVD